MPQPRSTSSRMQTSCVVGSDMDTWRFGKRQQRQVEAARQLAGVAVLR
jgi:hypothetical protein